MRRGTYKISRLSCPGCGNRFPIPRKANRLRKNGHIKDIWCPFCGKVMKMTEEGCSETRNSQEYNAI